MIIRLIALLVLIVVGVFPSGLQAALPLAAGSLSDPLLIQSASVIYQPPVTTALPLSLDPIEVSQDAVLQLPVGIEAVWVQPRTFEYQAFVDQIHTHYTRNLPAYGLMLGLFIYKVYINP